MDFVDHCVAQWQSAEDRWPADGLSSVMRVMRLSAILESRLDAVARRHGLSVSDYDVLATLRRQPDVALTAKALCEEMLLTSGTMTNRIDKLERRGFVSRKPDPQDRRAIRIGLTKRGRALIDKATPDRAEDAEQINALLSTTQRRQLDAALRALLVALEQKQEDIK